MEIKNFKLHPSQQDVYTDQCIHAESPHYNLSFYVKLSGRLNREKLHETINSLPTAFDIFRMGFDRYAPDRLFYSDHPVEVKLEDVDFSDSPNPTDHAERWIQQTHNICFEVGKGAPLFAHFLLKISEAESWLLLKYHHVVVDSLGLAVLVNYISRKYRSLIGGHTAPFNYPSYLEEVNKATAYKNSPDYEIDGTYWKEKISEKPKKLLRRNYPEQDSSTKGTTFILNLNADQRQALEDLQLKTRTSIHQLTVAALIIYFGKVSGQSELVFGLPHHKRDKEAHEIVGMFAGILPFKGTFRDDITLIDLLAEIKLSKKEDNLHRNYPIGDLARHHKLSIADGYLCDVLVNYIPYNFELDFGDAIQASIRRVSNEFDRVPLEICWQEYTKQQPLELRIHYHYDYFVPQEIQLLAQRIIHILGQFPAALNSTTSTIDIIPVSEKKLLHQSGGTAESKSASMTIIDLIVEQSIRAPDQIAVVFEEERLTYKQLNELSNQLAHHLRARGVAEEVLVPVVIDRSLEMIIAVLGILKAGGAYVPIAPNLPEERIKYQLQDTAAQIVVSSDHYISKLNKVTDIEIVALSKGFSEIRNYEAAGIPQAPAPGHLAYVIYTSGSTGKPKGVMIEHSNLLSYLLGCQSRYMQHKHESFGSFIHLSYTFDASLTAIFLPLMSGKSIVVGSTRYASVFDDPNLQKFAPYDFIKVTPSQLQLLQPIPKTKEGTWLTGKLVVGGEALHLSHVDYLIEKGIQAEIINEYGPTEATVGCTIYCFETLAENKIKNSIPIGKPLPNSQLYIVSGHNELQPMGEVGEICIGGLGVARGYLNRTTLTSEKFIDDTFDIESKGKMYKTGDLGRWLADGNIEYLGRKDDQVKIRGYRIELGEIESVLSQNDFISEAVVVAKDLSPGQKRLIAYVKPRGLFDKDAIIDYLRTRLPEYMLPAFWVCLESFPLSTNGKVDKEALPVPDTTKLFTTEYVAPRNEIEEMLASTWKKVLKVDKVGIHDNFFDLGGDSIQTIQVVTRMRQLGYILELKHIFAHETIAGLSTVIRLAEDLLSTNGQPLAEARAVEDFLIPVRNDGTKIPFFAMIEFPDYRRLGNHLDDRPLYYLHIHQFAHNPIDYVASRCIAAIKAVQPSGPYYIAGYCDWGSIAFEMAQQLTAQGDEVRALILIDFYFPGALASARPPLLVIKQKVKRQLLIYRSILTGAEKPPPPRRIGNSLKIAGIDKYRYQPYAGKVILFQASERSPRIKRIPHMGWSHHVTGSIQTIEIEGSHHGIFHEPEVKEFADKLKRVLN